MNYSWFGVIGELESAQAVAPQKPQCGATVCAKSKSICIHFDIRKRALNVLLYMKATHLCILYVLIMYLNNVLSYCTHILYEENEVGPDS